MSGAPIFTVFTPTYNRLHTIRRTYESLMAQDFASFEWVVVDDGSSDGTVQALQDWSRGATFPTRVIEQENSGKHVAFNRAVETASGSLFLTLDSDDELVPSTLSTLWRHWDALGERQAEFVGVTGLVVDRAGTLVGTRFPADVVESDDIAIRLECGGRGDRKGCNRVDVLRQYPYPVIRGEKFMSEAVVWNRIAKRYKKLFVNDVVGRVEYRADGLSRSFRRILRRSPRGACLYYGELLEHAGRMGMLRHLQVASEYVRYSMRGGRTPRDVLHGSRGWMPLRMAAIAVGGALALGDRWRYG